MKSSNTGTSISKAEILNISAHGIWLYVKEKEYFLTFKDYPWFKNARVSDIYDVELLHGRHLYWESLDVDLEISSLEHPERYPLKYS